MEALPEQTKKREEILAVARELFLKDGYEGTSVSRLARQAGVAPNTIYWYFTDKDALLLAVMDSLVVELVAEYSQRKPHGLDAQVLWLLDVLERAEGLIATLHARVSQSQAIHDWHARFHTMLEAMLAAELRVHGVPEGQIEHASRVAMFVVEGLLAHRTPEPARSGLVRWMMSTLEQAVTGA